MGSFLVVVVWGNQEFGILAGEEKNLLWEEGKHTPEVQLHVNEPWLPSVLLLNTWWVTNSLLNEIYASFEFQEEKKSNVLIPFITLTALKRCSEAHSDEAAEGLLKLRGIMKTQGEKLNPDVNKPLTSADFNIWSWAYSLWIHNFRSEGFHFTLSKQTVWTKSWCSINVRSHCRIMQ